MFLDYKTTGSQNLQLFSILDVQFWSYKLCLKAQQLFPSMIMGFSFLFTFFPDIQLHYIIVEHWFKTKLSKQEDLKQPLSNFHTKAHLTMFAPWSQMPANWGSGVGRVLEEGRCSSHRLKEPGYCCKVPIPWLLLPEAGCHFDAPSKSVPSIHPPLVTLLISKVPRAAWKISKGTCFYH